MYIGKKKPRDSGKVAAPLPPAPPGPPKDWLDLSQSPHLARNDQIVALPTLVRKLPEPIKRIIGDLSNVEKVLVGLDIAPTG